jgi:hypothetical protein
MSKICIISFLLLFFHIGLYCQPDIGLGFKSGASFSNISRDAQGRVDVGTKNRIGLQGGVFLSLLDSRIIGIQSDLFYEQKTANFTYMSIEGTYRIDYLSYSLKARWRILKGNVIPYIGAGFKTSIYLNNKADVPDDSVPAAIVNQLSDNCKRVIFSPLIAAGVEVKTSKIFALLAEFSVSPEIYEFFYDRSYEFKAKSIPVSLSIGGKFLVK